MFDLIEKLKSTGAALLSLASAANSPPEVQAAARAAHEAHMAVVDAIVNDVGALDEKLCEMIETVKLIEGAMPKRVDGSPAHRPVEVAS